jgi:hypothetical protein
MTIRDRARVWLRNREMTEPQIDTFLDRFAKGAGRDIDWEGIAPYLEPKIVDRIDRAALGFMTNPANARLAKQPEPQPARDGKALGIPIGDRE